MGTQDNYKMLVFVLESVCYIILIFQARKLNAESEIAVAGPESEPGSPDSQSRCIISVPHCLPDMNVSFCTKALFH